MLPPIAEKKFIVNVEINTSAVNKKVTTKVQGEKMAEMVGLPLPFATECNPAVPLQMAQKGVR